MMKRNESHAGHRNRCSARKGTSAGASASAWPFCVATPFTPLTALETGATEIWTNDGHLLAAAAHPGLAGRSV